MQRNPILVEVLAIEGPMLLTEKKLGRQEVIFVELSISKTIKILFPLNLITYRQ